MTTISNITTTPQANADWIDALIGDGPDWNYLVPSRTTLYYTFDITTDPESQVLGTAVSNLSAFNTNQQGAARSAFSYIAGITGITFTETASGADADLHLAQADLEGNNTSGLTSTAWSYNYRGTTITRYAAEAYVYLDNAAFASSNASPSPGTWGYETLLHELGHALGLKHPFEGDTQLPSATDKTSNTLMSYTEDGGPYSTFQQYDLAALNFLYGTDGLAGSWGVGGEGAYYTGTSGNESFTAGSGVHTWVGGAGSDRITYSGSLASYTLSLSTDGNWLNVTGNGVDDRVGLDIEDVAFADGAWGWSSLASTGTTDMPASTASLASVSTESSFSSSIGSAGDVDWIRADLIRGALYSINLKGVDSGAGTLADPYIYGVYNSAGILVGGASDNDSGTGRDALLSFAPPMNDRYYIAARDYEGTGTGLYALALSISEGDDRAVAGTSGNDTANGGAGIDTFLCTGYRSDYTITRSGGNLVVTGSDTDTLSNIERLQFYDQAVRLGDPGDGIGGTGGANVIGAYFAMFGRAPEPSGYQYWLGQMAQGDSSLGSLVDTWLTLDVVKANGYPGGQSIDDFIRAIYLNVFNKAPDDGGYWRSQSATMTRGSLVDAMLTAAQGVPEGTAGKAYVDNKTYAAELLLNTQYAYYAEMSLADLTTLLGTVSATSSTIQQAADSAVQLLGSSYSVTGLQGVGTFSDWWLMA